jgi:hypothetical protein
MAFQLPRTRKYKFSFRRPPRHWRAGPRYCLVIVDGEPEAAPAPQQPARLRRTRDPYDLTLRHRQLVESEV